MGSIDNKSSLVHVMVWHRNRPQAITWTNNDLNFSNIYALPRNMHTVFALLCFVVVIHWLIFPHPSGLLHWHCGNLTIAPVPAKQLWWIWINTSCEFIMNDCITTTKQSITKPCAYFLGYTVYALPSLNMSRYMISMYLDVSFVIEFEMAMHTNWHYLVSKHPQAYQCPQDVYCIICCGLKLH